MAGSYERQFHKEGNLVTSSANMSFPRALLEELNKLNTLGATSSCFKHVFISMNQKYQLQHLVTTAHLFLIAIQHTCLSLKERATEPKSSLPLP